MTPVTDRPCQSPATAVLRGGRLPRIYYRSELVLVASQSNWLFRGTSPYALELALGPVTTGGKCSLFLTQESFQILGLDTLHTAAATPPPPRPRLPQNWQACLTTTRPIPSHPSCPGALGSRGPGNFGFGSVPSEPKSGSVKYH